MIKRLLCFITLLAPLTAFAERPPGFLWYNIDKEKRYKHSQIRKSQGTPFSRLSYTDKDAVLRFYTMEALHKARHSKSIEDMRVFLKLQDYWLKESTRFSSLFQKTMLHYPEYDYTVTHPTNNIGVKITDSQRELNRASVISKVAKRYGILFFYRGANAYDQKEAPIVHDFCKRFNIKLITVSIDGVTLPDLPAQRIDHGQANTLGIRYFPAIVLVNPRTKQTTPVAYGFVTQDKLEARLFQVATAFQGESA